MDLIFGVIDRILNSEILLRILPLANETALL